MTIKNKPSIGLVGCGKMGAALLQGWLNNNKINTIDILDPNGIPESILPSKTLTVSQSAENLKVSNKWDALILAVKPQIMEAVCHSIADKVQNDLLVLSIAAGQSTKSLSSYFSKDQPVIRAMPNTPVAINKGMTTLYATETVSSCQKQIAETLMQSSGTISWIDNEEFMHAITALSGSGPAYLFYLIEVLEKTGKKIGLPDTLAKTLARQTIIGSAALAEYELKDTPQQLRRNVTSPGGTTEAALSVLTQSEIQEIFDEALEKAKQRSIELAA